MNEKPPNSMLDALAREAKPAEHPSADVLAAFVERALAEGERQSVTNHLARCSDCREVVFLASDAAEETAAQQAMPAAPDRTRWRRNIAWAAPLAAVLLLVGGYFVWQGTGKIASRPELTSRTVAEAPVRTPEPARDIFATQAAPPAGSSSVAKSSAMAAPAMIARDKRSQPASSVGAMVTNDAPPLPAENKQPLAAAESPNPAPPAPAIAIGRAMAPPAMAPRANAFAQSESEAAQQYGNADSLSIAVNRLAVSAAKVAHPGWRITPQGKLEHLTSEGWTQVLADQKQRFRVVSITANHVWAGGDGGALFHSNDGGQHWTKVSLATGDGAETAAIVTIRFDDPLHGAIGTLSGSIYVTTDGGTTWTKQ